MEEAQEAPETVLCDEKSLKDLVETLVECSDGFSMEELLGLHHQLKVYTTPHLTIHFWLFQALGSDSGAQC